MKNSERQCAAAKEGLAQTKERLLYTQPNQRLGF